MLGCQFSSSFATPFERHLRTLRLGALEFDGKQNDKLIQIELEVPGEYLESSWRVALECSELFCDLFFAV